MENIDTIEKITLLISTGIVCLANLFVLLESVKKSGRNFNNIISQKLVTFKNTFQQKVFMKTLLSITLILSSFLINAQDTIYFKDKTIIAAKISEVGISEIKYLRQDNLTGPTYTNSKKDIKSIKYSNGRTDTILFTDLKKKEIITTTSDKQMVLVGTDIYYNNKVLGEFAMRRLITTHAASENQVRLIRDVKKLKIHERSYNALGTGLFVTGFAVPAVVTLGTLSASFNSSGQTNTVETIVAGAVAGALLRISGHVVMKMGKNKTKAKKLEFLKKYNQNEIFY